jgi:outer membrane receptor protein involved in Fe transport
MTICGTLLSASALAQTGGQSAGPSTPTEAPAPVLLEEVTVTGTRIKRKDLEAQSPLVTVDSTQLESKAGLNIESYLNTLPQYNVARTPTTENFDVQATPINTVGISTISLRGFGANRSLVLVDGHRTTPVNPLMITDINGIPSSMIDRIETISGGASAVYGADAIGGVTNFITKKDFQGATIDAQDSITQAGDGNELRVNGIIGTKIGDNKGNLLMGIEYYNRDKALKRNRDFFRNSYNDPNVGTADFFTSGLAGYDSLLAPPSLAAAQTVFPARPAVCGFPGSCTFSQFNFNSNGTLWNPAGALSQSGYLGSSNSNGYALQNTLDGTVQNPNPSGPPGTVQTLKWSNLADTVSSPQQRYSFFVNGTYDITDNVQFYANARFASSQTSTLLGVVPSLIFGWEASVPYNATTDSPINPALINNTTSLATLQALAASFAANPTSSNPNWNPSFIPIGTTGAQHPVPWQLALLLNSRSVLGLGIPLGGPGPFAGTIFGGPVTCNNSISASLCRPAPVSWELQDLPYTSFGLPGRGTQDTTQSWQIESGFRFPVVKDWTGDVYISQGQSTVYNVGLNDQSLERWRAVIDSPGYGQGQTFQGNQNGASTGFGTSVPSTCTSGFYNQIFGGDQTPSADCMNAITATLQTWTQIQQTVAEADFAGSLFKLPAGDLSANVGYQYRRDSAVFTPDQLQSTSSFLDQTIGVYPSGSLNQAISSRDIYAELYVPIVRDLSILRKLDLDLGGRYSKFDGGIPSSTTFKVNMDAQITKSFTLRGGFNRADRAPNLGELYLSEQEYFGAGAHYGDPCSLRSIAPFGAGGAAADIGQSSGAGPTVLAPGQTTAGANSTYLICQAQMGATGAGQFYGTNGNQAAGAASAVFAWLNQIGNSKLRSEQADTYTVGFVFNNLSDHGLLAGLNGSVDYWKFNIQHAIELDSVDEANYLCYGTATVTTAQQAAAQAATTACSEVGRNQATGGATTEVLTYTNAATIDASGIDIALNWLVQLQDIGLPLPGAVVFNSNNTVLNYYKTKASAAPFDITIDWKGSAGPTLANLDGGAYSFRTTTSIGYVQPAFGLNLHWTYLPSVISTGRAYQNAIVKNNNSGATVLGYVPDTSFATPAWSVFDLSGNWNLNKYLTVRGGINNLLGVGPPITGRTAGYPSNRNVCPTNAPGCTNPSAYSLPSDGAGITNAGWYAEGIYGRTFFLGVKATF